MLSALVESSTYLDPTTIASHVKNSSKGNSRSSSGSSTPTAKRSSEDGSRHKIQLSEDQLYGPFNFMDRRRRSKKQKSSAGGGSGRPEFNQSVTINKLMESNQMKNNLTSGDGSIGKKTPIEEVSNQ